MTVSKGLIGKNDIKLWDGRTQTFTHISSSGRHLTLNKIDWPGVDVMQVYGGGSLRTDAVLTTAKNSVGASNKVTFWLSPGTWTIASDLTITSNITLVVPPGAIFSVSSGKTLTIQGGVTAGRYQIFSGSGTITISSNIIEHDRWRDDAGDDILPSVDNAIDLGSSAQEFKDIYIDGTAYLDTINLNGTAITATAAEINTMADGQKHRAKFRWKDGDEIYIGAGVYSHNGTTRQTVFWDAEITFVLQSGGSNSDSDDYGADGWHYIYLDDSAIVTNGSPELVANCFLNETTAPTWSAAKHGWYNGSDKCILGVYETGGAILEFFHDGGDLVLYGKEYEVFASAQLTTSFADLDISAYVPAFSIKASMLVTSSYVDGTSSYVWRTNGQSGAVGHVLAPVEVGATLTKTPFIVFTDSAQVIEHKESVAKANTYVVDVEGWFFPAGV